MRRAIAGDNQATSLIAERVEGRVGIRRAEVDPEAAGRRAELQANFEKIVRAMTELRLREIEVQE